MLKKLLFLAALTLFPATAHAQAPNVIPGCVYNATPPTLADKQTVAIQCDSAGKLKTTGGSIGPGVATTCTASTLLYADAASLLQCSATIPFQITDTGLTTTSPGFYSQITGDTFPRVRVGLNATDIASVGFGSGALARDTFIERVAAATLRLGAPDAAAPVAQTLGVQNVVTGTTDTAGASFTINGSRGTGTGTGGSINFQVATAGSTGSTQNALATAATINSAAQLLFSAGSSSAPSISFIGQTNLGFIKRTSAIIDVISGGNASISFQSNGNIALNNAGGGYQISSGNDPDAGSDLFFRRRGAGNWNLGAADAASPVAQTLSVQGSRAGTDSNVGGANWTINPSIGTGIGTPANIILNGIVGATTGTGTQTTSAALTIAGAVNGQVPSVVVGAATLATTATDGFLYVSGGAGPPTGVPTAFTGRTALYWDLTNNQLYAYSNGSWKQPKTPAAAATVTWQ